MRLDELTPLMPERDWDELITASMRRGRTLRRRRQALVASPLAAVLAVIVAIPLSGVFEKNHDGLARLHTTNVGPAQSAAPSPVPTAVQSPDPVQRFTPGPGTLAPSAAPPATGLATSAAAPLASAVQSNAAAARQQGVHWRPLTLAYADSEGDANAAAGSGAPSATQADDPSMDVVKMRFRTTATGLEMTMWLASDFRSDGQYWVFMTDKRTGCQVEVELGGNFADTTYVVCGSTSTNVVMPNTVDPSYRQLMAVVPYDALPAAARPTDVFDAIKGEARQTHPLGGSFVIDDAATSHTFGPMVS